MGLPDPNNHPKQPSDFLPKTLILDDETPSFNAAEKPLSVPTVEEKKPQPSAKMRHPFDELPKELVQDPFTPLEKRTSSYINHLEEQNKKANHEIEAQKFSNTILALEMMLSGIYGKVQVLTWLVIGSILLNLVLVAKFLRLI